MSHYLVVSLDSNPPWSVVGYVTRLLAAGVRVSLVVVDERAARLIGQRVGADPGLKVRTLLADEARLPVWRFGRLLGRRLGTLYMRFVGALARPWLLGRRWRTVCAAIDPASVQRLVAADVSATTLVWHLSRRCVSTPATTALDHPASPATVT